MQPYTASDPLPPDALRVVHRLDWSLVRRFQRIDLGHAEATVDARARAARHMARNGFSWPTFVRSHLHARNEARRWIAWKKSVGGDAASATYELVVNDVAKYLAAENNDPYYELAEVPVTDVEYGHPDPYYPNEIEALQGYRTRDYFTELRRRAMHLFSSFTGPRRVEHSRIDDDLLDLDRLTYDLQLPGKRGRKRRIPLPSLLRSPKRAFMPYLDEKRRLFPNAKALWVDQEGKRLTPNVLSRETFHMGDQLGFTVSFNRWRRSWQTTLGRCGVPKDIRAYILGHNRRDATDHYWEIDVEDARASLVEHEVPGYIRSRTDRAKPTLPLPVPFARVVDAGDARETETAVAM